MISLKEELKKKGGDKMKRFTRLLLPLVLALIMVLSTAIPVYAATTADVTVTATPTYIAMTNSLATWSIGAVLESQADAYWWDDDGTGYQAKPAEPFVDAGMPSILTNTGSVNEDMEVKTVSTTWAGGVGWTVAAAIGVDTVVVKAGCTGMANEAAMKVLTASNQDLKTGVAPAGTIEWTLHLETGTFTDGSGKTGTVRITATAS